MNTVMKVKFTSDPFESKGYCELTEEMDTYLLGGKSDNYHTYMYDFGTRQENISDGKEGHVYVMRVPGATRGCIITDKDNIIERVEFYEDSCYEKLHCYDREIEKIKEKYIGRKVITERIEV